MKRISSAAMISLLLSASAPSLLAQESDILGQETPPLESLTAFSPEDRGIAAGTVNINRKESLALKKARLGERVQLSGLQRHLDPEPGAEPLQFRRVELFAPGARVMLLNADGAVEWQQDGTQFFVATNSSTGVGLAVDVNSGEVSGFATKGSSKMSLQGQLDGDIELEIVASSPEEVSSCSTQLGDQPPQSLDYLTQPLPESLSAVTSGSAINYQAVVAVDTDNEWMAHRNNDPALALKWIKDAFLAMNVFYERDVETRLLIGDVILRIEADPYSVATNTSNQMNEFATYWRLNLGSIDRDFATLFSGRGVSQYQYSGIAWLNNFCKKGTVSGGRTVGSYSFNGMGVERTPANTAIFIGHELGHNMGSPHTHCYSPVIDQCYNGEGECYSGTEVCPAGGNGRGTIMSYCHTSSGASCGPNNSEFHPRVQTLIQGRLAANSPSCIAPYLGPPPVEDILFDDNFE